MKRRIWLRVALATVFTVTAALGYIFWPATAAVTALPDTSASHDVHILRDTWGVPHIFGKTDPDASYGLAYAHAEDDFLTIQQTLLAARGRLASVYGQGAAANDYMVGLLRIWDVVNAKYDTDLSPEARRVFEAYADGLNEYARLHPRQALPGLFPVTGKDVVAASVHKSPLFFGLDKTLGELFAPPGKAAPAATGQAYTSPSLGDTWVAAGFRAAADGTSWSPVRFQDANLGSNTFAVSPQQSANNQTMLDVNSHQPWSGPVTWYEAHVHSDEGWDMVGATFPATPVIIHGHNRDLGWAFTVNKPDLIDVYDLEVNPTNKNQYRFDGKWLDFDVRQVPIRVKLLGRLAITVKKEALWTVYGPAMRTEKGTFALRYGGFGEVGLFEQLYRMNKAGNFQEWQDAMRMRALPSFNVGYADKQGNIYYLYNADLPVRNEAYHWTDHLPGNTSETLWTQYIPFDHLPQVLNPASGFIQNANSTPFATTIGPGNPKPGDYSPTLGIEMTMTNRAQRLLELLGGQRGITEADFAATKFDEAYSRDSRMAKLVAQLLTGDLPDDPDIRQATDILRRWDLNTDRNNPGAALAVLTFQPFLSGDDQKVVGTPVLIDSLKKAADLLKEHYGRLDPPWEAVNRLRRGAVDLGLGGAPDTVRAVYGDLQRDGHLVGKQGDSYIMLVTWNQDGKVHSRSIHQYGSATLDAASPHYADQAALFAREELKPVWFDEVDIRAHLEREYRPGQEGTGQ